MGSTLTKRARLALYAMAWHAARILARGARGHHTRLWRGQVQGAGGPGVSIILSIARGVPAERDTLAATARAVAEIDEPAEVIVVGEGTHAVAGAFACPVRAALCLRAAVDGANYDWVYLLAGDIELLPGALGAALAWRAPELFAACSTIDGPAAPAGVGAFARGTLAVDARAGMIRRTLLQRFLRGSWPGPIGGRRLGVMAWLSGYEVVSCPWSRARSTTSAPVPPDLAPWWPPEPRAFAAMAWPHRAAWTTVRGLRALFAHTWFAARCPGERSSLTWVADKYYARPDQARNARPALVFVSPFPIHPPTHGGARRMHHLLLALAGHYRVIVLCDEVSAHDAQSVPFFAPFHSVHLVGGRTESAAQRGDRVGRIDSHCHAALRAELRRLLAAHAPSAIQVEYVELARLIADRGPGRARWILDLHDVLLREDRAQYDAADRYESAWIARFDRVLVCSREDEEILASPRAHRVDNGVDLAHFAPQPTSSTREILFCGPFRYAPNLIGIERFLREVYPALARAQPGLRLRILGGAGAPEVAAQNPLFAQDGVEVHDLITDVRPYLAGCALTINPVHDVRGSSLKVLESLAAGRVCVSTRDGARGLLDTPLPGLVVVADFADLGSTLARLLGDRDERARRERDTRANLHAFGWDAIGRRLLAVHAARDEVR